MSKTSKNILGDQRGKIGKVVGRVLEGEQMYSAAPGPRGSHATPKQKEHRARFSAVVKMGKPLKGAIKIGMKESASKKHLQSPFNLFVTHNLRHTTYDDVTGLAVPDYEAIVLSEGVIPFVSFEAPSFADPLKVTVAFNGPQAECHGYCRPFSRHSVHHRAVELARQDHSYLGFCTDVGDDADGD